MLTACSRRHFLLLTALTLHFGASWYGYGYCAATLLTLVVGLFLLDRKLDRLEYETFMLQ